MGWFRDYRSHRFVGRLYGITLRFDAPEAQRYMILQLDRWAWERELRQKAKSNTPNDAVSAKQKREAMAFGAGARDVLGITDLPYPSPPYPGGSTWS